MAAGIRTRLCKLSRLLIFTVRFNTLFVFIRTFFTRTLTLRFDKKFNKTYGMKYEHRKAQPNFQRSSIRKKNSRVY